MKMNKNVTTEKDYAGIKTRNQNQKLQIFSRQSVTDVTPSSNLEL